MIGKPNDPLALIQMLSMNCVNPALPVTGETEVIVAGDLIITGTATRRTNGNTRAR